MPPILRVRCTQPASVTTSPALARRSSPHVLVLYIAILIKYRCCFFVYVSHFGGVTALSAATAPIKTQIYIKIAHPPHSPLQKIAHHSKKVGCHIAISQKMPKFAPQLKPCGSQAYDFKCDSGCSSVRLGRLLWEQEVPGSNPGTPTKAKPLNTVFSGFLISIPHQ